MGEKIYNALPCLIGRTRARMFSVGPALKCPTQADEIHIQLLESDRLE